jgi:hypothetical protein
MTTAPLFHYDAAQHAHVAEWEDCIFTGKAPARDPRGDFYIDLRRRSLTALCSITTAPAPRSLGL